MSMRRSLLALLLLSFAAWSFPAAAHISLDRSTTHKSRYGDDEIKDAPCGRAGGTRGTNIYTYAPGDTITVSIAEFVPHPSYFRIAFDQDGDDDFVDPVSIKPIDPNRPCPYNQYDQCGLTDSFQDFYNTPAVLPGMDNLDPHLTATFGQQYSWQVTLPNVECDNCTLQIIQVMEDVIHGGYNTDKTIEPSYIEDVYHQCIDLVLTGNPGTVPDSGSPTQGSGGTPNATGGATSATGGATNATGGGGNATGGAANATGGAGTSSTDGGPGTSFDDGGTGASNDADEGSCSCALGAQSRGTRAQAVLSLLLLGLIARRRGYR